MIIDQNTLRERYESGRIVLFDKPIDWTSFDLVKKTRNLLRHYLGFKKIKVGHTGTLDPLATGLMILCIGKATKSILNYQNLDKEYLTTICLGKSTPSFDLESKVDRICDISHINEGSIKEALQRFMGETEQVPPLYSAKYIEGKRAYNFARKGEERTLAPVKVRIDKLELLEYTPPEIRVRVVCSKGTYIRALARDLGIALQSGAHLTKLRRIQIGDYHIDKATSINEFEESLKNSEQIGMSYV